MAELSEKEVETISNRLQSSGIRHTVLTGELLDHYCCLMEEIMANDLSFEEAYRVAYQKINPNGPREIEEELTFLLTFNKQISMKKLLYSAGLVAAFGVSTGLLFKVLYWPGANWLFLIGFGSLILLVVPIMLTLAIRNGAWLSFGDKARVYLGILICLLIGTGTLLKILHLQGGSVLFLLGMSLLNIVFLPLFFYHLYQKSIA